MNALPLLELAAAALAGWAAYLTIPRPPDRDLERIFKVALSSMLWSEAEAAGGGERAVLDRWDAALRAQVPFHPAGRAPEDKLFAPSLHGMASPALEGERALVEALIPLPGPAERWQRMYVEDPSAADALTAHPEGLGPSGDPSAALGAGAGWEAVSAWAPSVAEAVQKRFSNVIFAVVGDAELAAGLREAAPGLRVVEPEPRSAALGELCAAPADRVVWLWRAPAFVGLLQALEASPALIDRSLALVQLGAPLADGPDDAQWLAERWRHASFEPELQRLIPIFSLIDAGPNSPRSAWEAQALPEPALLSGASPTIERISLGPLPLAAVQPRTLARALLVPLSLRLLAQD